jgi:hypothetical protein
MVKATIRVLKWVFVSVALLGPVIIWYLAHERGTLVIEEPTEVLIKPFSPWHSAEKTLAKNGIIKVLQPGERIKFSDRKYEKDFAYYEVEVDGQDGYIIIDNTFRVER